MRAIDQRTPELGDATVTVTTATTYVLRYPKHGAYALFTVNDTTGELSVHCDWGEWSHRWPVGAQGTHPDGRPATLTEFLAGRGNVDYIANKLVGGRHGEVEFSSEQTRVAMRRCILKRRRDRDISKEAAAWAWSDGIEEYARGMYAHMSWDAAHSLMTEELQNALGIEPYDLSEVVMQDRTFAYVVLVKVLLPDFQRVLHDRHGSGE